MQSPLLISLATFIYGLSLIFYVAHFTFKRKLPGVLATGTLMAGVLINLAAIVARWVESYQMGMGRAPFTNLFESLVLFALATALVYLALEFKVKTRALGPIAVLMAFVILAYASLQPDAQQAIQPLIPALQSNWLTAHVITCFLGYAAFAIAFGISLIYLLIDRKDPEKSSADGATGFFPPPAVLDDLIYQTVSFGFFFLSVGIITGAVWANSAWGRYWGWDPKETWSLITWFVYASLLHARLMRGWQGRRIAWMSIVGFAAVIFTYFGVNLLPGLHSYM